MEPITSRKNQHIRHFRALCSDRAYRREQGEYICDGEKLLREALSAGAEVTAILCRGDLPAMELPAVPVYGAPAELFRYVSPLEESPGPLFTVRMKAPETAAPRRVLILENLQDPGNVGTVLRSAAAFGVDMVALVGACADAYNPKAVRASMGAVFRQRFVELSLAELPEHLARWRLPLYAAALDEHARDVRTLSLAHCAVAVGNEGKGLSPELLALSDERVIIPMAPGSESLNAAMAAGILLWEMRRSE